MEGPVSKELVEPNDEVLLIMCDISSLDVRSQVIQPTKPATLPTSLEPCPLWKVSPFSFTMKLDVFC